MEKGKLFLRKKQLSFSHAGIVLGKHFKLNGSSSDSFQKWEDKTESQVHNYVCQDGLYFLMSLRDKLQKE